MDGRSKSITFQSMTIPSLGRSGYSSGSSGGLRTPMRCLRLFVFAFLLPCLLIAVPLYQRRVTLAPRVYTLTASDIRAVEDGISSVWCEAQELTSETPFTSYRAHGQLPQHSRRLPVTLSHKLTLSDDVREFWGFYLLRGSRISVSACARWPGTSLLLVHGWKALNECVWVGQVDSVEEESSEEEEEEDDMMDDEELDPVRRQWREFLRRHPPPTKATQQETEDSRPQMESQGGTPPSPAEPTAAAPTETNRVLSESQPAPVEQVDGDAWSAFDTSDWTQPASTGSAKMSYAETQLFQRPEEVEVIVEKRLGLTDEEETDTETETETEAETETTPSTDSPVEPMQQESRDDHLASKESFGTPLTNDVIERKIQSSRRRRRRRQVSVSDAEPAEVPPREQVRPSMVGRVIPLTYNGHRGRVNQTLSQKETSHSEMMSSFSSSEEAMLNCEGVIVNQPLRASALCSGAVDSTADQLTVQVIGDDYYYLVFYSENEVLAVDILFDVMLEKTVYDVRAAESVCANSTVCRVPLGFWSSDNVVLEYPVSGNVSEAVWSEHYTVRSSCQPRGWIVAVFIVAALFSLFVCAFC